MKAVYKVLQGMMIVSLLVFAITSCTKTKKTVEDVIENEYVDEDYVDLGLPSGTLWKSYNEDDFYTFDEAIGLFGDDLPSIDQFEELIDECDWEWEDNGFWVTGPNGNYIFLEAEGYLDYEGHPVGANSMGYYLSSTEYDENDNYSYHLLFQGGTLHENYTISHIMKVNMLSVRLVQ